MANDFCDKIWRMSIGHYGGKYVEIPKEHFNSFKQKFPSRQFPRRVKAKVVQDMGFGIEFEEKFHKKYPRSGGKYYDMHFADRSKGLKTLEKLLTVNKCHRKGKWKW